MMMVWMVTSVSAMVVTMSEVGAVCDGGDGVGGGRGGNNTEGSCGGGLWGRLFCVCGRGASGGGGRRRDDADGGEDL